MNDSEFNDPLADFDPVMESAFSVNNPEDDLKPVAPPENQIDTAPPEIKPESPPPQVDPTDIDLENEDSFFDTDESFDIDETLFEEKETEGISVSKIAFDSPKSTINDNQIYDKNLFKNIKVDVSIELGRSQISLKKLYELKSGSILEIERLVGEPLDLVINDQVIARGEVVAVNSNYGIRITHIDSSVNIQ
jgi:flagellar motor switch protein FliN/FliY